MSLVRHLLIQSRNRVAGVPDDFIVQIPPITELKGANLLSASIPNTIYNVTSANNTLYWTRGGARTASLSPGAYDYDTLADALKTAMDTADGTETYTISFSDITMKVTISCTAAFSLICTNTTSAMWYIIGFTTLADTPLATSQTANGVLRLDFPAYLLISVKELCITPTATTANTRASYAVSMSGNSQYVEVFNVNNNYENPSGYTSLSNLSSLSITLRQPDGSRADLNGGDWSMLLGLDF